jgi:hypothetical protein
MGSWKKLRQSTDTSSSPRTPATPAAAGAVVPAPIEDDDLAGGRKVGDVALHVHLGLLAVRRRRQRHDPEDPRAHAFGDGLDGAPFAGGVPALEDHDHAQPLGLHPLLQHAQLRLQALQLGEVLLVLQLLRHAVTRPSPDLG